ncbi:hypothetical protein BVC80_1741g81 [Macleaya cordata]|uniref:Uncharacterized protein n=1 Tax=Macleaya cordata TaxID=56857 RepID=A0A200QKX7_MACCD|nr:hypothetical protein BVC80_1741g81 [Macleaya cordata]
MDFERAHRSGSSSSELFICFTSRPSTTYSSMKISSSKSIRSPGHGDKSHEPTLTMSSSLKNRRLRANGSIKAGQFSPMFPSSKKRGCAFETPEPSSPKVTCIGQVRVKTKKQGKKMLARTKRKTEHKPQDGVLQQQQQQQHACLPHRNQKWAYFPFTICEALRSFGADLNCFLPCGSRSLCSSSMGARDKEEKGRATIGETDAPRTSCGPIFERWLMALQEGEVEEKIRREDMEMMLGEEEEEEEIIVRKNVMEMELVGKGEAEEESDEEDGDEPRRVSICLPPKNALLLMRCRSDPLRMSSLANRFWDSPLTKVHDDDDDDDEYDDNDEDSEDDGEEEEEMNLELEEKHKVEEVLEKWSADENSVNSEDTLKKEEQVNSVKADHQSGGGGGGGGEGGEEKDLEQNEVVKSDGSSTEAGENPRIEEESMLQEVEVVVEEDEEEEEEQVVELNTETVESPRTEEEPMLEEVLEEDQDVEHNTESVENPRIEKEPMLLEVQEVDQEVEQNTGAVENKRIEESMLQEVLEEDQEVEHNTEAVENPRTEEEPMLHEVLEEDKEVEHNSIEAVENPRIEEEPMLQEIVIGILEEEEEEGVMTARSSEVVVQPDREEESEPAIAAAAAEEAVLDLDDERVEKSTSIEEKESEDRGGFLIDGEEIESIQEKSAISVVKEEQGEEQIYGDYDDYEEEKSSTEEREKEREVVVLPDCMMWMMMCEPKLSMEVSKETWVCSRDFIRSSWPNYDRNPIPPQLILNNKAADDGSNHSIVQQQQQQLPPSNSSCSINRNPSRSVVLSMASMIEQKLAKAVPYEPLVLMRCKSEPLRSSSKFVSSQVMNFDHAYSPEPNLL